MIKTCFNLIFLFLMLSSLPAHAYVIQCEMTKVYRGQKIDPIPLTNKSSSPKITLNGRTTVRIGKYLAGGGIDYSDPIEFITAKASSSYIEFRTGGLLTLKLTPKGNNKFDVSSYGTVFYGAGMRFLKLTGQCWIKQNIIIANEPKYSSSTGCPGNLSACANDFVCRRGFSLKGGIKAWHKSSHAFYMYSVEAKKRGLSCGVGSSSSTTAEGTCLTKASLCGNTLLCRLAAPDVTNGKKVWFSSSSKYYKYVVEAKKRGLSCGVETSSSKPVLETKVTKPVPTVPVKKQKKPSKPLASLNNPLHFKSYGNTYHTPLLSNVIFFIGEIKDGHERGFRKALRNHKADTVVLISDGGLVGTGLELANIINDNNLSTYVPLGERCASACSFMFFAGNPKVAHGGLGVHQFYVDDDKKKMAVGKVQKGTQYLIGDIIENLEAFGTPSSVYPKMLSTSGMYFFSEEEKSDFNSNPIDPKLIRKMNEVLVYISKSVDNDFDDSTLNSMPTNMKNSLTQLELVRIGCMKGPVDGVKGETTMSAIKLFSSKIGSNVSSDKFSSLFRELNNTKVGACY